MCVFFIKRAHLNKYGSETNFVKLLSGFIATSLTYLQKCVTVDKQSQKNCYFAIIFEII